MSKIIFTTCWAQNGSKIKNTQNLLKFDICGISNIPILILMSKIIFIKYLPPVQPKLVPKLKVLRIYWNLAHSIFQICQSRFWCQKWFLLSIYHLLGPDWFQYEKCSELIEIWLKLIFDKNSWWKFFLILKSKLVNLKYQICQISMNFEYFQFGDQFGVSSW